MPGYLHIASYSLSGEAFNRKESMTFWLLQGHAWYVATVSAIHTWKFASVGFRTLTWNLQFKIKAESVNLMVSSQR